MVPVPMWAVVVCKGSVLRKQSGQIALANERIQASSLKLIGLADEVAEVKEQITKLVQSSAGSDEPAAKKARVEQLRSERASM